MIKLKTGIQLKEVGLQWNPAQLDYFAIPDRGLDELVFVINEMTISVDIIGNIQVVTFSGAAEWALDYLTVRDIVWLPREDQIREELIDIAFRLGYSSVDLICKASEYCCMLKHHEGDRIFFANNGAEAYALAYLTLRKQGSYRIVE